MSQATQQVLPTIDEETPFHKGDVMSTQEVVEHESDFVAQKPSNDMNKGSENILPTIGETQIHEGNTRSEEKMVVVENQSDVQTSPKPSDNMMIKDTYNMPLRDEEVEGSEKKDEANEEHQGVLATTEVQDKVDKGTGKATRNANKAQSIQGRVQGTEGGLLALLVLLSVATVHANSYAYGSPRYVDKDDDGGDDDSEPADGAYDHKYKSRDGYGRHDDDEEDDHDEEGYKKPAPKKNKYYKDGYDKPTYEKDEPKDHHGKLEKDDDDDDDDDSGGKYDHSAGHGKPENDDDDDDVDDEEDKGGYGKPSKGDDKYHGKPKEDKKDYSPKYGKDKPEDDDDDSLTKAKPIAGAKVKLACQTGPRYKSFFYATATSDANGFFLISVPHFDFRQFSPVDDCVVILVSSPVKDCSTVTDINMGKTGGVLRPIPIFAPSDNLMFSVGPFAFAPKQCSSNPPTAYNPHPSASVPKPGQSPPPYGGGSH
ncbi:hypothetical protein L7F22_052325 [Adiantum nelumboides]|nr:hypothetical protein [Adiantum nelumboides]